MKVSIVTIATAERDGYLWRLLEQKPSFVGAHEWIVAGPRELAGFCYEAHAIHVVCDVPHGTGRNLAVEAATGDLIVHFDDDDWQAPDRIAKQVRALSCPWPPLCSTRPELVGSTWLYCLNTVRGVASRLTFWGAYACLPGASMAYTKAAWRECPFIEGGGEDGPFSDHFRAKGTLFDMRDPKLLVYVRQPLTKTGDWWYETRSEQRSLSMAEQMRERIQNPHKPLPLRLADVPRDIALRHEEEAATVYVRWLMGGDFDRYVQVPGFAVRPYPATP
jgi:hypothetical protein